MNHDDVIVEDDDIIIRKDDLVSTAEISQSSLDKTPEFYKSIPNNPSVNRLRSLDVRQQIPYVSEFLFGKITATVMVIPFEKIYQKIPLVTGLYYVQEFGFGEPILQQVIPNNFDMTVTTKNVTIGTTDNAAYVGGKFKLKVYNLDLL